MGHTLLVRHLTSVLLVVCSVAGSGTNVSARESLHTGKGGRRSIANEVDFIDYGSTYLNTLPNVGAAPSGNRPRFALESRLRVTDRRLRSTLSWFHGADCKAEFTFASSELFQPNNYNFTPVFGADGSTVVFRRELIYQSKAAADQVDEDVRHGMARRFPYVAYSAPASNAYWGSLREINFGDKVHAVELDTYTKIESALRQGFPLVARSEFSDSGSGLDAWIEYPVKTLNMDSEKRIYQVDTGPVIFPDLSRGLDAISKGAAMSLAYVAFNSSGFADFILEAPVQLETSRWIFWRAPSYAMHFSKRVSVKGKHVLYAIEK